MSYFAPYIDDTGLHMPTYEDRLDSLLDSYRSIFGQDCELSASVPDYQLLSVFARALDDVSALTLSAYASRNPLYASGDALSLLAPLYGLTRLAGESDDGLRARMVLALAARGAGSADSIAAAAAGAKWVREAKCYVNDTDTADDRGIPGHSAALVVNGGDGDAVAQTLWEKVSPGVGTYGTTEKTVTDTAGNEHTVRFSYCEGVTVYIYIKVRVLETLDETALTDAIVSGVTNYVNSLGIAVPLVVPRLYAVIYESASAWGNAFAVSDAYALKSGESAYTRDCVEAGWSQRISTPRVGGVTVTVSN